MNRFANLSLANAMRPTCVVVAASAIFLSGCADMGPQQRGTATGAAVGAGVGAVISSTTGGKAGTGAVVGGALGAIAGNIWSKRMEEKREAMEQATRGTGIDVTRTADNQLRVNVPSDFSFDTGSSTIKPEMRPVLDQFARGLDAAMRVSVVGHTDATGTYAINNPLSLDRAEAVRDYLAGHGVAASRIEVSGEGSRHPVANNGTADGRARNRRVEIFLRQTQ